MNTIIVKWVKILLYKLFKQESFFGRAEDLYSSKMRTHSCRLVNVCLFVIYVIFFLYVCSALTDYVTFLVVKSSLKDFITDIPSTCLLSRHLFTDSPLFSYLTSANTCIFFIIIYIRYTYISMCVYTHILYIYIDRYIYVYVCMVPAAVFVFPCKYISIHVSS